jgi:hypothetical protein
MVNWQFPKISNSKWFQLTHSIWSWTTSTKLFRFTVKEQSITRLTILITFDIISTEFKARKDWFTIYIKIFTWLTFLY